MSVQRNVIAPLVAAIAIAVSCSPAVVAQGSPPRWTIPTFDKDWTAADSERKTRIHCMAYLNTIETGDRQSLYRRCQDDVGMQFRLWRENQSAAASGTGGTGSGGSPSNQVCSLSKAQERLISEENPNAPFTDMLDAYNRTVQNLKRRESEPQLLRLFGLARNTEAQKQNLRQAQNTLEATAANFRASIRTWAAASDEACFDCAVIERWNILKGASNLIAKSWEFGLANSNQRLFAVGLNPAESSPTRLSLSWTQSLNTPERDTLAKARFGQDYNSLTRPIDDGMAGKNIRTFALNAVQDQWIAGLPPTLFEEIKKRICDVHESRESIGRNAYNIALEYFVHARGMQELINTQFESGVFQTAHSRITETMQARSMTVVIGGADRKCSCDDFEMSAFNVSLPFSNRNDNPLFNKPGFCGRWYDGYGIPRQ